jgi:predicted glutamine amidotransferase
VAGHVHALPRIPVAESSAVEPAIDSDDRRLGELRRDLLLAVDPSLFDGIAGSADSEVLFHLALNFGLEDDPSAAMERAVGFVEEKARGRGVENPARMTVGISGGRRVWAVRYSSSHESRTLFVSEDVDGSDGYTPTTSDFRSSPRATESRSRSRSRTCRAPGSRFPSPPP